MYGKHLVESTKKMNKFLTRSIADHNFVSKKGQIVPKVPVCRSTEVENMLKLMRKTITASDVKVVVAIDIIHVTYNTTLPESDECLHTRDEEFMVVTMVSNLKDDVIVSVVVFRNNSTCPQHIKDWID
jgi:hypothetical protein